LDHYLDQHLDQHLDQKSYQHLDQKSYQHLDQKSYQHLDQKSYQHLDQHFDQKSDPGKEKNWDRHFVCPRVGSRLGIEVGSSSYIVRWCDAEAIKTETDKEITEKYI